MINSIKNCYYCSMRVKIFLGFIITLVIIGAVGLMLKLSQNRSQRVNSENVLKQFEKDRRAAQDKAAAEYNNLLEKQGKQDNNQPVDIPAEKVVKARGDHILNVILVKPDDVSDEEIAPLVGNLKKSDGNAFRDCVISSSCPLNSSLYFVETYIKNQARMYGVNDFNLRINVYGVYPLSNLTKIGDIAYFWGKDPFGIVKLKETFESVISGNNLVIPKDSSVVFLYFDKSIDKNVETAEVGFYETKKFRSFADYEKGRIYANVYKFSPDFSKTVVEIVIHETLHLFGAQDKYIEDPQDRICGDKGHGDVKKIPVYPQTTGDVMCLFVEQSLGKFQSGDILDGTLVINQITAKEIGWVDILD